jgi:integrase
MVSSGPDDAPEPLRGLDGELDLDGGAPSRRVGVMAWAPARRAAGLPEDFTFHGLRHFYASLLIRQGLSVKATPWRRCSALGRG